LHGSFRYNLNIIRITIACVLMNQDYIFVFCTFVHICTLWVRLSMAVAWSALPDASDNTFLTQQSRFFYSESTTIESQSRFPPVCHSRLQRIEHWI
jgi:hypothetical protein